MQYHIFFQNLRLCNTDLFLHMVFGFQSSFIQFMIKALPNNAIQFFGVNKSFGTVC